MKPGLPITSTPAPPSSTGDTSTTTVEKPSLSRFSGVNRLEPSPNLVKSPSTCLARSKDSPAKGVCIGMSTTNVNIRKLNGKPKKLNRTMDKGKAGLLGERLKSFL